MGIETGNDRIRNDLLKRRMSKEQILEAAHLIREGGLHLTTTNMIGLPTSTLEDDFETLELNVQARPVLRPRLYLPALPPHRAGRVHPRARLDGGYL